VDRLDGFDRHGFDQHGFDQHELADVAATAAVTVQASGARAATGR
jgi:hypothetical protein